MAAGQAGGLLPVADALRRIVEGVLPLPSEAVPLAEAGGRVLAEDVAALLTQPPFEASAMDGYAVRAVDVAAAPAALTIIGEAAAGRGFSGRLGGGEAVRIFTGAPLPGGSDTVVIQENTRRDGPRLTVLEPTRPGNSVRTRGLDFAAGQVLLTAGRRLTFRDLTLLAAMGHGTVPVRRRPQVALLATGDELVPPGTRPGPDQIVSSLTLGLAGLVGQTGGVAEDLGIARDSLESLDRHLARAPGADLLVTIGGASVGDYDLVHQALSARGMALDFWKIAMRPGKPLMHGRLGSQHVVGLPGNPVSAMMCARIFLVPLIRALTGAAPAPDDGLRLPLAEALPANGPRTHYMRANQVMTGGRAAVRALANQDSSLISVLARADCLIVVPPDAPALPAGSEVDVLPLDF